MTDIELRIKVAELVGFSGIGFDELRFPWPRDGWFGKSPDGHINEPVPDYPNDLNAIAEAVLGVDNFGFRLRYVAQLELDVLGHLGLAEKRDTSMGRFAVLNATARQRALAFIRVLTNEDLT